ncbi:MAG: thiF family protein [Conexibacter sp.]|nr:thiF family protein [Conexibacter sp.]
MLADYYSRSALAAAQVLEGFDPVRFRAHLEATTVGLSVRSLDGEAGALADLAVRLLARLYPSLEIRGPGELAALARAINPNIDIVDGAKHGIVVGDGDPFEESVFAGSDGWVARVRSDAPMATCDSSNPVGAGAAACLATAAIFRRVFLDVPTESVVFDAYGGRFQIGESNPSLPARLNGDAVLAGAGAIGNGALWALARVPVAGVVHVVDHEDVELSNLQRYVLANREDEGAVKVDLAARDSVQLELNGYRANLGAFLAEHDYRWPTMMLGLDSARDRVAAQASLPEFIINAWTQPGDLGISAHSTFGGDGACVSCLYLPAGRNRNEDELVAETLGIPHQLMDVRTLLHTGGPVQRPMLEAIAQGIGRPLDVVLPFEGRSVRELYVEGFCGGAVIPLGQAGRPVADVHVPLAHQSALAGILLAGALLREAIDGPPAITTVTRLNVLDGAGADVTQPARAARNGRCICDDADFCKVYEDKYRRS